MSRELPTGTVTFVFTDIEGSTSMVQRLGDAFVRVLEDHHRVMRQSFAAGVEIRSEGDAFFFVFPSAPNALDAACTAQRALAGVSWPEGGTVLVRIGIHTGEGIAGGDDYVGVDVHRAARIAAAGHGGQILLSAATKALCDHDLSSDMSVVDLGIHRFKDLQHPEHVFQLVVRGLPADYPPIRSLDAAPNNLPTQATPFVGRRREVEDVQRMLRDNRLVTLTGPGGSGKTRLALHVAAELQSEFRDGVYYIPLEALSDPGLVLATIAERVGTSDAGPSVDDLALAMADDSVLLLIDNFEHLLEGAPAIAELLAAAPGVTILVTSQGPLAVRGEHLYPVPPLAEAEAIELFVELSSAADPTFAPTSEASIREIVEMLDRIPLALELTAPRVRLYGVEGLRDRLSSRLEVPTAALSDVPDRHRSLNDAIAWSYDLLDDGARSLLRQLSIFEGGFTLDAAEAVAEPADRVARGVAELLDRSLLRQRVIRGEARFSMLESIRRFAYAALDTAGERDDAARRHAAYYVALAEAARPHLDAEGQQVWLDRLADEHDNIRAALRLSRDQGEPDLGLLTTGSIWRFYHRRNHLPEARQWLEALLAMDGSSPRARAIGLNGLGGVLYWQTDHAAAKAVYDELLGLYKQLGDEQGIADTLFALSTTTAWLGDLEEGKRLAAEARAAYEAAGAPHGAARVAGAIAWTTWQSGDIEEAYERWTEARGMSAAIGDDAETREADVARAAVLFQLGRGDEAVALIGTTLEAMVAADDAAGTIQTIDFLASLTATAHPADAVRLAGAADALRTSAGGGLSADSVGMEPVRSIAASSIEDGAVETAWADGAELDLDSAVALARTLAANSQERSDQ
jgi:predicted ATPase/class 3 adenylate cyclase